MKSNTEYIESLIIKHLECTASSDEEKIIKDWVEESPENKAFFMQYRKLYNHSLPSFITSQETDMAFDEMMQIIGNKSEVVTEVKKKKYLIPLISVAASIAVIICLFVFNAKHTETASAAIAYSSADSILDFTLSDSSIITVSEHSSVTAHNFKSNIRMVELQGKAFFDVTPDPSKPFIVKAGKVTVTVLGTSFEIDRNQSDDMITVSVLEGKVEVYDSLSLSKVILTDNQSCTITNDRKMEMNNEVSNNHFSWKTGMLVFDGVPLKEALKYLEEHYDKTFVVDDISLENEVIYTKFKKADFTEVKEVLSMLLKVDVVENDSAVYLYSKQ